MGDALDKFAQIVEYCDARIKSLSPQIGRDELGPRIEPNKAARNAIAKLVRQLSQAGLGDMAAQIEIGDVFNARQAVGILTKWRYLIFDVVKSRTTGYALPASPPPPEAAKTPAPVIDDLVTLDQVAPLAGLTKRSLERYLSRGELPDPDIRGGGGRSHKWYWGNLRPDLAKVARRPLPERFPGSRIA